MPHGRVFKVGETANILGVSIPVAKLFASDAVELSAAGRLIGSQRQTHQCRNRECERRHAGTPVFEYDRAAEPLGRLLGDRQA
jgi:hypothetical protein